MVENVIFDVDGTLIDSVDEHAEAWRRSFIEFGRDIPFAHVRSQIGKGSDQLLPVFFNDEELERFGKDLDEYRSALFKREFLPKVRAFPRVKELFQQLRKRGRKIALASSAKDDELKRYVELCGIDGLFETKTNKDEVDKSKPHPDIFEAAMTKLGKPDPATVVVVGDTPYDALAAGKLHLASVGVLCGGFRAEDLRTAGCRTLVKDPAELLRRLEEDPEAWPWDAASRDTSKDEESR
ncbi:HAD family hydrolase [Corallococcus sp. AB049A]|uniref:HAD family hydrolase n=1 Tax=Corallococcus interemptor TaxID=2316720 RepID=A0A3A8QAD3_9BACT|nr:MULTISPECIES: HAD family hydrolase [Corallococcus]RKH43072.1 HAD family hydrolase [Corallococcus sp. AB050B]RKH65607.1 HAD family hydrolase [Corallococcus interemptor]RKI52662.1 HAD family hydrolase [Corallococcus sp. AB049A]